MANADTQRNGGARKTRFHDNDTGLWEALQRFWQQSYAGDYLGVVLLLAAYLVLHFWAEPFHKMFRLDDARIQFPHAEVERVPPFWLFLYAGGMPLAVLIAGAAILRFDMHKAHVTILGLAISVILTCFLTDVLKDAVGRPRPDLIARCIPESSASRDKLITVEVCTETRHNVLHDGWRSWPSGHSSFAFAGLGYLALFFASQTHAIQPKASLALVLLCLTPLVGAALIAISRLEDYRHDVFDVVCGSLLGLSVAYFNWRRYYPNLLEKGCDEPYPPWDSLNDGFKRVRDEEDGLTQPAQFSMGGDGER